MITSLPPVYHNFGIYNGGDSDGDDKNVDTLKIKVPKKIKAPASYTFKPHNGQGILWTGALVATPTTRRQ